MTTVVVGVIGHVDHGKTALVGALTGIDTDRLAEEKRRGISINLGFAHREETGGTLAFVDMPGHERFVRTMIAGATGIDAVLLVVDAREGVKPQTIEHLDIARLVGVTRGVVAVSRCDLVAEEEALRTASDVRRLLDGTALAGAPLVFTSTATGRGMDKLASALGGLLAAGPERQDRGVFYMPADRAFAVPGFGPVVTGTLRLGRLRAGDTVALWPSGGTALVRGLHAHGKPVEMAQPGSRVAVNLRAVELADLGRGCALATPGLLAPSHWLDAGLSLLKGAPRALENGTKVQFLFGTTDIPARVRLLDRDLLEPGQSAPAQLHCTDPVAVPAGEPFILRLGSPARTIGGGRIADPASTRRRRFDEAVIRGIQALSDGRAEEAVALRLASAAHAGLRLEDVARLLGVPPERLDATGLGAEQLPQGVLLGAPVFRELREILLRTIRDFQRASPTERGMPAERLRAMLPPTLTAELFEALTARLIEEGALVRDGGVLRRRDLDAASLLSTADRDVLSAVEAAFREGSLSPPDVSAVAGHDTRRHKALHYLARTGVLVRALDHVQKREITFHRDAVADAVMRVRAALAEQPDGLSLSDLGRLLGTTRKFSVPLMEHMDRLGVTQRKGDRRVAASMPLPPAAGGGDTARTSRELRRR
ncbi:selenocysteine-specific translation elongation factor [Azospirillum sp. SYSU D00513]|uniref:selenocysteine-specific translation elongation factor n=1 Tax=Azospirillum sp. SYSU D00513 TaxID=2812561 RepID=UPI001A968142|nr:selenocysteine-specific translation elongation factor [Azospirillum sp. SYSU D00513]